MLENIHYTSFEVPFLLEIYLSYLRDRVGEGEGASFHLLVHYL